MNVIVRFYYFMKHCETTVFQKIEVIYYLLLFADRYLITDCWTWMAAIFLFLYWYGADGRWGYFNTERNR